MSDHSPRPRDLTPHAFGDPARLRVGVVGAGRVGAVLGAAMAEAGHQVVAASGISEASRGRALALLPRVPILPVEQVAAGADLVLLTVPDDALADLVDSLADLGALREGQILLHTSGAQGLAPLSAGLALGCVGLALHPAMTFTGTVIDLDRLRQTMVAVTTEPEWIAIAEGLVLEWGAEPFLLAEDDRPLYHAALSHAANHLVTVIAQAMDLLRAADIEAPARVLEPLVNAAVVNALQSGDHALTGPVARGDSGTVRTHLRELEHQREDIGLAYRALARATTLRALASGRLTSPAAAELIVTLEDTRE